jgi:hypothetical protein
VNGVQAAPEFTDAGGDLVSHIGGEVRESALDPIGDGFAFPVDGCGSEGNSRDQGEQQESAYAKAVVKGKRTRTGRQKNRAHQKHGECADIENAFHHPDRELR